MFRLNDQYFAGRQGVVVFLSRETENHPNTSLTQPKIAGCLGGSLILTGSGLRAVEDLTPGDLVLTRDQGFQPIKWVASAEVSPACAKEHKKSGAVCLSGQAIGSGQPAQDLFLAPDHRVLVLLEGSETDRAVFIRAKDLPHAVLSKREPQVHGALAYWHIGFEDHQVIFANGCPIESFQFCPETLASMQNHQRFELEALYAAETTSRSPLTYPELGMQAHHFAAE